MADMLDLDSALADFTCITQTRGNRGIELVCRRCRLRLHVLQHNDTLLLLTAVAGAHLASCIKVEREAVS